MKRAGARLADATASAGTQGGPGGPGRPCCWQSPAPCWAMQHVSVSLFDEKSCASNLDEYYSRYVRWEALL